MTNIRLVLGNITFSLVDCIVNAANENLDGGAGVDGAIHAAAGPDLLKECLAIGGCPTGESRLTNGYNLDAKHIIHTVGPVWYGGYEGEEELLKSCYKNSLKIAAENGIRTIAFPAISTGAYEFPPDLAAKIAVQTTKSFLDENSLPEEVTFVCFDDTSAHHYRVLLEGNET